MIRKSLGNRNKRTTKRRRTSVLVSIFETYKSSYATIIKSDFVDENFKTLWI